MMFFFILPIFVLFIIICPWSIFISLLPFNFYSEITLFMNPLPHVIIPPLPPLPELPLGAQPQVIIESLSPPRLTPQLMDALHLPHNEFNTPYARILSYLPLGLTTFSALAAFGFDYSTYIFAVPGVILDVSYYLSFHPTAQMLFFGPSIQSGETLAISPFPLSDVPINLFSAHVTEPSSPYLHVTNFQPLTSESSSIPTNVINYDDSQTQNNANPQTAHQRYNYFYRHFTTRYNAFIIPIILQGLIGSFLS